MAFDARSTLAVDKGVVVRIAVGLDVDGSIGDTLERVGRLRDLGFRAMWSSQIFGPDTLTVLALVGRAYPDVDLGTAVVPVQPRHPSMLAAQARTVQDAIGGRLTLGVGLSHQVVVEGLWGIPFERPVSYMRDYLSALAPMLRGEPVSVRGDFVSATTMGAVGPKDAVAPALVVAALGPKMLELAGALADGTVLWMTGPRTIAEHIVPTINAAAATAGRPAPRVVCSLPVVVTDDVEGARARVNETFAIYATLPSYAAMLEREGASAPADVAIIGTRDVVVDQLRGLADVGVSEFSAVASGTPAEREAALAAVLDYDRETNGTTTGH